MNHSKLGFGVTGDLPIDLIQDIARHLEATGFHSFWFNETSDGDAIARISAAAAVTRNLTFGTGVINLDTKSPQSIIQAVQRASLPLDRVMLGVGASAKPHPLATVKAGVAALKDALSVPVVVGSLGPRMRQLGAEYADGLLFNWLPPVQAGETTATMRQQAGAAGNDAIAATYIRTALGKPALLRLESEAAKYSSFPSYAANFERLGITAMQSAVYGEAPEQVAQGIAAFDGTVDFAIVRAITANEQFEDYKALIDAVRPLA